MTGLEYSSRGLEVPGQQVEYRAPEGDEDNTFEVRMPIATTGEVRNQGDDPLTRDELTGMAQQVNNRNLGVFLDHGSSNMGGPTRYSAVGKLGEWREAEVDAERADDADALVATAEFMDPETLPAATGQLRENLAALKEQVKRGMSLAASIGWRQDDTAPGGNDLMEASIVGIGADPRTTSDSDNAALVARAAVEAGADKDELLGAVREAIGAETSNAMTEDTTPDDEQSGGTTDDEQTDSDGFREYMRNQQEEQTELLRELVNTLREDDDDEDEDDEDTEENEADEDDEEDDDEDEQSAEPDDEQDAGESELQERIAELEAELSEVRSGDANVATPDTDSEQNASDDDGDTTATATRETWGRHRN